MRLRHEGSMIGVHCQLVICRGHIRLLKNIFLYIFAIDASMKKLNRNSNFSIFHDLRSDFKVSEMGWEVKNILRGQSKHGLWGSNLKTGKFLPGGAQEQI